MLLKVCFYYTKQIADFDRTCIHKPEQVFILFVNDCFYFVKTLITFSLQVNQFAQL